MVTRRSLLWGGLGISALAAGLAWRLPWRAGSSAAATSTFAPDFAPNIEPGKALFSGGVALQARMLGHETDLPPSAVRCANCHSREDLPQAPRASASTGPAQTLGAALSRRTLLANLPRRGGPPSHYQLDGFCRVLRDGVDPASVMIAQTMPRYRVTDQECLELWNFLTAP